MIKKIKELTKEEKQLFYQSVKTAHEESSAVPWQEMEMKMRAFLDAAFDDKTFPQMSSDDQIDAAYCRKAFSSKPDLVDYMLWSTAFVTHSDYVEIPEN